jgi:N-methylhydantoinase B
MRGGTGVCYEARQRGPSETTFRDEASRRPSGAGVLGGRAGAAGTIRCQDADGAIISTPAYGTIRCGPMELFIESAGGGGWGDPMQRDPEAVRRDVLDELVSLKAARTIYGVILSADLTTVDREATSIARRNSQMSVSTL